MVQIDKKKVVRTAAIARFAKFIQKYLYNRDWTLLAQACGVSEILDKPEHERVRRAQGFGDPDYPSAVADFLQHVFNVDEQLGLLLIHETILQENSYDEPLSQEARNELDQILPMFGGQNTDIQSVIRSLQPAQQFISVTWIPDDFYKRLIEEINRLYGEQLPISLSVLIRKLLENLLIDILRKKYGTAELALYYDVSKRRFHDFSVLVKNLDAKKTDFYYITSSLDDKAISDINAYRETGNAGAHSIDANLTIDQFSKDKQRVKYLVDLLLRILQNL